MTLHENQDQAPPGRFTLRGTAEGESIPKTVTYAANTPRLAEARAVRFISCCVFYTPEQTPSRVRSLDRDRIRIRPNYHGGQPPTANQMGTGDRLGLFRDRVGTIWGCHLAIMSDVP
jgi:hypothetical protein